MICEFSSPFLFELILILCFLFVVSNKVSDRRSRQNPLKQLVLVHFEAHTPDLQVLSKHAAIIGTEFDENVLRAIVPPKLKNILTACLDKLVEKRFIQCLDPQDRTFCFPNQLIQATIYELTPPRYFFHFFFIVLIQYCYVKVQECMFGV